MLGGPLHLAPRPEREDVTPSSPTSTGAPAASAAAVSATAAPAAAPIVLSLDPGTAQEAAAGQVFRARVTVARTDGSSVEGAHVLFNESAGSVPLTIIDNDVRLPGGLSIAEARIVPAAASTGSAVVTASVAGAEALPLEIRVPVGPAHLLYQPGAPPGKGVWSGSALDPTDYVVGWADLVLTTPSPASMAIDRGFEIDPRAQPALRLESQDVILSHEEVVIPANDSPDPIVMTSAHPPFEQPRGTAKRTGSVRISFPADPSVAPIDATIDFPEGATSNKREVGIAQQTPNLVFATEDLRLTLEPVSGYTRPPVPAPRSGGAPPAPPVIPGGPPRPPVAAGANPPPRFNLGPVRVARRPSVDGPIVGTFTPQLVPQVGTVGEPLPIGFQVQVVDDRGDVYAFQPHPQTDQRPGDKLVVQWRTRYGTLGDAPGSGGSQWLRLPIDKPAFFTPTDVGPWYLDASIPSQIFDERAPVITGTDVNGQSWSRRSTLQVQFVYRFIVQAPVGSVTSTAVPCTERLY